MEQIRLVPPIELVSSSYVGIDSPGTHASSDWQVYEGGFPLTSTNTITNVNTVSSNWILQNSGSGFPVNVVQMGYDPDTNAIVVIENLSDYISTTPADRDLGFRSWKSTNNGTSWTVSSQTFGIHGGSQGSLFGTNIFDTRLAYGANGWVGQIDFVNASGPPGYIYFTSTDGLTWNEVRDAAGQANTAYQVYAFLYEPSNQYYYYCSNYGIFRTLNPATSSVIWTNVSSTKAISLASDGAGTLVAVDNTNIGQYSVDNGATWTSYTLSNVQNVTWAGNQFIGWAYSSAGGGTTTISTSPDGQIWTQRKTFNLSTDSIYISLPTIGYVNGTLAGIGGASGLGGTSQTFSYDNGITWTTPEVLSSPQPTGIPTLMFGTNDPNNEVYIAFGQRTTGATVGQFYYSAPPSTTLTIFGTVTDGFKVGDIIDNCGSSSDGTISIISNSTVTLIGEVTGFSNGDNICMASSSYALVDQSLGNTTNLTEYAIPDAALTEWRRRITLSCEVHF
jgi:hypothetical protein